MEKKFVFLFAVIVVLIVAGIAFVSVPLPPKLVTPADFEVYVVSSMVKLHNSVGPYADLTLLNESNQLFKEMKLSSAKNEGESVQLVISAASIDVENIQIFVSDFLNSDGAVISNQSIELFYEYFVKISEPTDFLGGTGYYADALPPLNNVFNVEKKRNQPIWVKMRVPKNAVEGVYSGKIRIESSNAGFVEVPVSLSVWNFTIPDEPSLTVLFGLGRDSIKIAYGLNDSNLNQKLDEYITFMLKNKVTPFSSGNSFLYPNVVWNGTEVVVSFSNEQITYLKKYLSEYNARAWQFPIGVWMANKSFVSGLTKFSPEFNERFKQYLEKTIALYEKEGIWNNIEFFTWIIDEPNSLSSYIETNNWSRIIASASPKPKFMITEQVTKQNNTWPDLEHIDIWCPSVRVFALTERTNASLYEGKEWWWYNGGNGADYPAPNILDREVASSRIMPWYSYKLEANGYLNWAVTYWGSFKNNPWNDPKLVDHTGGVGPGFSNGDGYFFYPSTLISQYTPMNDFEGVTTSIRWESFIDGMEDYEYLYKASISARQNAFDLVLNPYPFSKSPETFKKARELLADDIVKGGLN
ncbi:MAG: glycoside hydrolase domain-containing protein [Candidatus Micrarchaeota archaeon]